jgi:hypothetical protein
MLAALAATLALGSGAAGTVVIDPARPVCQAGQSCSAPDARDTLVFWRGSTRVARVQTSAAGAFHVALPPGYYRITFPRRTTLVRPRAPTFRVQRSVYTQLHLSIDIGIR